MNQLRNRVNLIGNLGQDPEQKTFENGKSKVTLRLATNEKFRDAQGELKENTQWHNVVLWGPQAETAMKILRKGCELAVDGRLNHQIWEEDGKKRSSTEIVAYDFLMLSKKDA